MEKILHIAEAFGSGVFNYIKNLCLWQCRDFEVYIAYGIRPETPPDFQKQFDRRIRFIKVDGFTREIELWKDLRAFLFIQKLVKDICPDIIHLHSTKAGVLGRWAVGNRYPLLYSPHAYSFLMRDCSKGKRALYRLIEKASDKKGCITIADIEGEYEASRQVTARAICIPNGINPDEMDGIIAQAERLVEETRKTTVCMVGKAVPQKNPELFNEIALHFPEIDFVWIGSGPLEHKLTSPNIQITGWLNRVEATARIMASDIFLFPSAWESLSLALLEVMYIGKPCVVSLADGNKDVIHTGVNGYACVKKEDYIKAIRELLDDREMAKRLGRKAHSDIVEKYNVYTIEKSYRELYKKLGLEGG